MKLERETNIWHKNSTRESVLEEKPNRNSVKIEKLNKPSENLSGDLQQENQSSKIQKIGNRRQSREIVLYPSIKFSGNLF